MNPGTAITIAVGVALSSAEIAEARAPHHAGVTVHADSLHLDLASHLHGDDSATAAPPLEAPQMPPGRGVTWAMQQEDPYWGSHAAIMSSMPQFRNAALLYPAYRGGLKTETPPEGGAGVDR